MSFNTNFEMKNTTTESNLTDVVTNSNKILDDNLKSDIIQQIHQIHQTEIKSHEIIDNIPEEVIGSVDCGAAASSTIINLPPTAILSNNNNNNNNYSNNNSLITAGITATNNITSNNLTNNYRHSRAYRHFKNPPQPHFSIRTTTINGEELFINVLSWTRIVIPQEKNDPIPLYGGMRVPPGSPRCPPLCYAVMANPEVLKDSGRHSKDVEDRRAIIELMCDFVEAMNPDVKLTRNAVILKDRDISGELKDVWNAVQAQRDREREELMLHQRQQQQVPQHYHHQQINNQQHTSQQLFPAAKTIVQIPPTSSVTDFEQSSDGDNKITYIDIEHTKLTSNENTKNDNSDVKSAIKISDKKTDDTVERGANEKKQSSNDVTDSIIESNIKNQSTHKSNNKANQQVNKINVDESKESSDTPNIGKVSQASPTTTCTSTTTPTTMPLVSTTTTTTITSNSKTSTPKKEKLGGFLPNGCIFPRFKNSKNKDKDKDKDKDKEKDSSKEQQNSSVKSSNKEKTLLNSLKKVTSASTKSQSSDNNDAKQQQYEKNCINIENQMEKLDLSKLESPTHGTQQQQQQVIKLKAGGK